MVTNEFQEPEEKRRGGGREGREQETGKDVRETKVWEFLLERSNELGADLMLSIVFLIIVAFLHAGIAANG